MPDSEPSEIHRTVDHLFRQEAGKMVSVLTRIFGPENLETAEDVVQDTLIQAMQVWGIKGIPANPSAWLFRVARNKAIDMIRRDKHSVQYDFNDSERALLRSEYTLAVTMDNLWKEEPIRDDLLRMMFVCCHPGISQENRVTLILKTLCGFSTAEIASSFLTTEDTISKRFYRAKEFFRQEKVKMEIPSPGEIKNRTLSVLNSIYLLFNEGYNSTHPEELIRRELIGEATMLGKLLIENRQTQLPEAFALLALMHFHAARLDSRLSPEGEIVLLSHQDRSKWDTALIDKGNEYLNQGAFGDSISSYHLEAAIAFEHCTAKSFEDTHWKRILFYYDWLCSISPSPISALNRVIAVMQVEGPSEALRKLEAIADKRKLETYYLYHSLLGEIYSRLDDAGKARTSFETAIKLTKSEAEKRVLAKKNARLPD